jgi:hypothetical protein
MIELSTVEIEQVNGGVFFVAAALAFTVISAMAAGGYMVGKDMAERDNART